MLLHHPMAKTKQLLSKHRQDDDRTAMLEEHLRIAVRNLEEARNEIRSLHAIIREMEKKLKNKYKQLLYSPPTQ